MKGIQRLLVLLVSVSSFSSAWGRVEAVIGSTPLQQNPNLAIALPTTANSEILISREQYLISYNKNRRAPNYVAWKLEENQLGTSGRSNDFEPDQELETYLTQNENGLHVVQPTDYRGSCFDRGHQVPSGDRTDSHEDNLATFLMSNMIPQTPYLNRVIWEHLEDYTRKLVQGTTKKVYIFAGPIYDANYGSIGPARDIPVPSKDFKVIFILDETQTAADINNRTPMIAVIMPNVLEDGALPVPMTPLCSGQQVDGKFKPDDTTDWKKYSTTLADVEARSGITFAGLGAAVELEPFSRAPGLQ